MRVGIYYNFPRDDSLLSCAAGLLKTSRRVIKTLTHRAHANPYKTTAFLHTGLAHAPRAARSTAAENFAVTCTTGILLVSMLGVQHVGDAHPLDSLVDRVIIKGRVVVLVTRQR